MEIDPVDISSMNHSHVCCLKIVYSFIGAFKLYTIIYTYVNRHCQSSLLH